MTLNDIILRDLLACEREREAEAAEKSLAAYEQRLKCRLWRRRIKKALPTLAAVAVCALLFAVAKMI